MRDLELGDWVDLQTLSLEERRRRCDAPLPWDHIDSGVSKAWLAEDLERALAATVVPDCSFEGCSQCGVCGEGLGHNVVVEPPPPPPAAPPRRPPSEQVCRLRFRFAKTGAMALFSHLDLVRLLERALRRSRLPCSFSGGFHPLPRLQIGLALPLGVEGDGEWLDLIFTEAVDPEEALRRLAGQLPEGLALLQAQVVPLRGKSLAQQICAAHWTLDLSAVAADPGERAWQEACGELLGSDRLPWSGEDATGRAVRLDLRPLLQDLHWLEWQPQGVVLGLESAVQGNGRSLKPNQLRDLLADRLGRPLELRRQRRRALVLAC